MQQPFSQDILLQASMVDVNGRWQPGSIFRVMQEVSGAHAEGFGLGRQPLMKAGIAWVLTRASLQMDEYPCYGQTVTVKTWPGKGRHAFFPRHYTFEVDGREIGRSTTLYMLMDMEQRKMALPSRLPGQLPEYDIPAPLPTPGAIPQLETEPTVRTHQVRYTDLDFNGHVNNTRYVDWMCDLPTREFHQTHPMTGIRLNYRAETFPDEEIVLDWRCDDDRLWCRSAGRFEAQISF